jgi:hypothetical protein
MNITILGYKIRVELIILCILLIWFINANTFFSCAGGVKPGVNVIKEGMEVMGGLATATGKAGVKASKKVVKAIAEEVPTKK